MYLYPQNHGGDWQMELQSWLAMQSSWVVEIQVQRNLVLETKVES